MSGTGRGCCGDPRCGCCAGTAGLTPLSTTNRPGLGAIRYRVGTHSAFLETMIARLSGHRLPDGSRPLERLRARAPDDPALALLDAWATVADVLAFYQERIANEGYLATATERRSVLELARLVGYRLRPGVAASVYLAFTLEKEHQGEIPSGTRAQSIPQPGELPAIFETDEPLYGRAAWNALPARRIRPSFLRPDEAFSGTRSLWLEGAVTDLGPNDALLFLCGEVRRPYTVRTVEPDPAAGRTRLTYVPFGAAAEPTESTDDDVDGRSVAAATPGAALTRLGSVVRALREEPSLRPASRFQLARPLEGVWSASSALGPGLVARADPRLGDSLYAAYATAPVTAVDQERLCGVQALRVRAAPFGHNAPPELVFDQNNRLVGRREWSLAELESTLVVRLSSSDPDRTVDAAFGGVVDLSADERPPLDVHVTIADALGTSTLDPVSLGDLEETTDAGAGEPVFEGTFALRDVTGTLQARYEEEGDGEWFLRQIVVSFASGPQERLVTIREGTAVNGGSAFRITTSGAAEEGVRPGQVVVVEPAEPSRRVTFTLDEGATRLEVTQEESRFAAAESGRVLSLDAAYEEVVPGSWVIVDRADAVPMVARVERVRTISRVDYGIGAQVTRLLLDRPWLTGDETSLGVVRGTNVYARSESAALAEEPIEDDIEGDTIELDGLYDGLEAGRWLMVQGERTDVRDDDDRVVEGIVARELVMLAGVTHDVHRIPSETGDEDAEQIELPTDTLHTRLILSAPLAYTYLRETVRVNANVVRATHGETRQEVLGSGDGARAHQAFQLKQRPLTHVAAPTRAGVESTLEVRVDDVRWPERDTLLQLGSADRGYVTSTDDGGTTTVTFGDGERGARLPTGVENVTAVYRSGIGKVGNVGAGRISVLATRPLGVKDVVNPQRASGGADPESRDQARRNAPLAALALDRLVAVQDYADFARTFGGIGKASAARLSDGRREVVHLTIAGADDAPIDPSSDVYRNLALALRELGDPATPLRVAVREAVRIVVGARVEILEDHRWEDVERTLRAALLDALGFDRRELGQGVWLSEVIGVMQAIPGVGHVDVDVFDGISDSDALDPATLGAKLEDLAGAASAGRPGDRVADACPQPRRYLPVAEARVDPAAQDPAERIRPARLAYLDPTLPDTLVLTEKTR